jgi:hypothetical protein
MVRPDATINIRRRGDHHFAGITDAPLDCVASLF